MPADRWTLERSWPGDGARLRVADGAKARGWLVMPGGEADVVLASDYDALRSAVDELQRTEQGWGRLSGVVTSELSRCLEALYEARDNP